MQAAVPEKYIYDEVEAEYSKPPIRGATSGVHALGIDEARNPSAGRRKSIDDAVPSVTIGQVASREPHQD